MVHYNRYREAYDRIKPAIPYIEIHNHAGCSVDGSFLIFDHIRIKTSHFTFEEGDDRVQLSINSTGLYEVSFECCVTSGSCMAKFEIFHNGENCDGGVTYISDYKPSSQEYAQSGAITITMLLKKDDTIQIKGTDTFGSPTIAEDTMRLRIKALPMEGWDNNHAGRKLHVGDIN